VKFPVKRVVFPIETNKNYLFDTCFGEGAYNCFKGDFRRFAFWVVVNAGADIRKGDAFKPGAFRKAKALPVA
jgi:hypothetical protein